MFQQLHYRIDVPLGENIRFEHIDKNKIRTVLPFGAGHNGIGDNDLPAAHVVTRHRPITGEIKEGTRTADLAKLLGRKLGLQRAERQRGGIARVRPGTQDNDSVGIIQNRRRFNNLEHTKFHSFIVPELID